jgi:hypothetical protein
LARAGTRCAWVLGTALFCAGMAATGRAWWERGLWGGGAIGLLVYSVKSRDADSADKKGGPPE